MKTLNDNIKSVLSIIIIILFFLMLILILWKSQDNTVISQMLIGLFSLATGVTGYYYGYSQGASKKDEAQAILTANSQTATITNP